MSILLVGASCLRSLGCARNLRGCCKMLIDGMTSCTRTHVHTHTQGHNHYKNLQDAKIGNRKVYASLVDKSDKVACMLCGESVFHNRCYLQRLLTRNYLPMNRAVWTWPKKWIWATSSTQNRTFFTTKVLTHRHLATKASMERGWTGLFRRISCTWVDVGSMRSPLRVMHTRSTSDDGGAVARHLRLFCVPRQLAAHDRRRFESCARSHLPWGRQFYQYNHQVCSAKTKVTRTFCSRILLLFPSWLHFSFGVNWWRWRPKLIYSMAARAVSIRNECCTFAFSFCLNWTQHESMTLWAFSVNSTTSRYIAGGVVDIPPSGYVVVRHLYRWSSNIVQ